uniref:(California timema) hypothetical protein n=1 Tax=Timema californicum TaxID=61474 RepID=A0A7R9P360_TIMCA|nr:unnamed protein product [Timema californicum]
MTQPRDNMRHFISRFYRTFYSRSSGELGFRSDGVVSLQSAALWTRKPEHLLNNCFSSYNQIFTMCTTRWSGPRLVIDTDVGTDDALALILCVAAERRGDAEILGVTCVHGNTDLPNVCVNTLKMLHTLRRLDPFGCCPSQNIHLESYAELGHLRKGCILTRADCKQACGVEEGERCPYSYNGILLSPPSSSVHQDKRVGGTFQQLVFAKTKELVAHSSSQVVRGPYSYNGILLPPPYSCVHPDKRVGGTFHHVTTRSTTSSLRPWIDKNMDCKSEKSSTASRDNQEYSPPGAYTKDHGDCGVRFTTFSRDNRIRGHPTLFAVNMDDAFCGISTQSSWPSLYDLDFSKVV